MKYKIIHKNNSLNPRNRWINEFSNRQRTNPNEVEYATLNGAQATPLMNMRMIKSMENGEQRPLGREDEVSKP